VLIRAAGIGLCPGLEEQVASLLPAQSANGTSSGSVSMVRFVSFMYCVVYTPPWVFTDSMESVPTPWTPYPLLTHSLLTPYPLRTHSMTTPCPTMEWVRSGHGVYYKNEILSNLQ
jgi:hypothetical protein